MKKLVLVVLAMVMVTGCATFNKVVMNDSLVSQLAVEAATARVLYAHPMWAHQTVLITSAAIAAIDKRTVISLGDMDAFVRAHISWSKLMPEEQALLSAILSNVRQNLEDSFRAKGVQDINSKMIAIREVMQWINLAAKRSAV